MNFANGTVLNTYSDTVANLIAVIVTQFGKASTRFSSDPINGDIDLENFQTFENSNSAKIGMYIADTQTVLSVCEAIASSVGAQLYINRLGKLQLLKFGQPYGTSTTITINDILYDSINISNRLDVVASHKIGYAKNWTVQQNLLSAIPDEHKELFAKEWLNVINTNAAIKINYLLEEDPVQIDTLLISKDAALAEATRRTNYYSQQRTVYKFTGKSKLLSLKLGQSVVLQHHRFGLAEGKSGQVISLNSNWTKGTIDVEVVV
jgi:hypothetical protein